MTDPTPELVASLRNATVRDSDEAWHVECRFSDGQKFAAVQVDKLAPGAESIAHNIALMLMSGADALERHTAPVDGLETTEKEREKWDVEGVPKNGGPKLPRDIATLTYARTRLQAEVARLTRDVETANRACTIAHAGENAAHNDMIAARQELASATAGREAAEAALVEARGGKAWLRVKESEARVAALRDGLERAIEGAYADQRTLYPDNEVIEIFEGLRALLLQPET